MPAHAETCELAGLSVTMGVVIGSLSGAATSFTAPAIVTAADSTDQAEYWPGVAWTTLGAGVGLAVGSTVTIAWVARTNGCPPFELSMALPTITSVVGGVTASVIYGLVATSADDEPAGSTGQPLLSSRGRSAPMVGLPLLTAQF
jgi:hypothetical protein